jgi:hypothetical protein
MLSRGKLEKSKTMGKSPRFYNISGCYASQENNQETLAGKKYFPFTVSFPNGPSNILFASSHEIRISWVESINKLLGHEDVKYYYQFTVHILISPQLERAHLEL